MRIVFDLDGVICELKKPSESYSDVSPKKKVIQKMRNLKDQGHYLIIHTGRHMRTCNGDVTKVIEKIGKITEEWLEKWNVPYDELVFGKPYADIYIDDLGVEFSTSEKLGEKLESIKRRSCLGYLTRAEDVAHAVSYLLSEEASNLTGTTITVDAGSTA